jgi:hypothetical protein
MAGYLFYAPRYRPSSPTGGIYPNSTITIYLSETTTLSPIYYDVDLTTKLSNPISADSQGLFPAFYLSPSIAYRVILKDRNGLPVYDTDPYVALNSPFGTAISSDVANHVIVSLPTTVGPTLQVAGSSSNLGVDVVSAAGQDSSIALAQAGQTAWKIYQPAGSNDVRFNNGTDKLTLTQDGNLSIVGNLSVGSSSINGLVVTTYKSSTQGTSNTTSFFDDADINFASIAAGTYVVHGILFPATITTTNQGFKFQLVLSSGSGQGRSVISGIVNSAALTNQGSTIGASYTFANAAASGDFIELNGSFIAPVTSSLKLQWAQNSTSGNATYLNNHSFLSLTKVA